MKFNRINLPYLFIALIVVLSVISLSESRAKWSRSVQTKKPQLEKLYLVGVGNRCDRSNHCSSGSYCLVKNYGQRAQRTLQPHIALCAKALSRMHPKRGVIYFIEDMVCSDPMIGDKFRDTQCDFGLECRQKANSHGMIASGSPSYCQKPRRATGLAIREKVKISRPGHICSSKYLNTGRTTYKCGPGYVCRPKEEDLIMDIPEPATYCLEQKRATGLSIKQPVSFALPGDVCMDTGFSQPKQCPTGYDCLLLASTAHYKMKPDTKHRCVKSHSHRKPALIKGGGDCSPIDGVNIRKCEFGYLCTKIFSSAHYQKKNNMFRCTRRPTGLKQEKILIKKEEDLDKLLLG